MSTTHRATVTLRGTRREDLPLKVAWLNDPEVTEFTGTETGETTLALVEERFATRTDPDWIIEADGTPIGTCRLGLDDSKQCAGFGIIIGEKAYWSKGYGTAALREVLRVAFTELGLHRVSLHCFAANARGLRCYEKCGFRQEARYLKAVWKRGEWRDLIVMAILRSEWEERPWT